MAKKNKVLADCPDDFKDYVLSVYPEIDSVQSTNNSSSSEEVEEKRYRNFIFLLYPEWNNFKDILQDIKGSFKKYAYIKHIPESNELKEHFHCILCLDNPRSIGSLSRRLGIPPYLIKYCKSIRGSCRYLTHIDNDDKYQYNLDQVIVSNSFKSDFLKSYDDIMTDPDILDLIYNFIDTNREKYDTIQLEIKLSQFVCQNGYERVFKRYYQTICKYICY